VDTLATIATNSTLREVTIVATLRLPHASGRRRSGLATFVMDAFWVLAIGIVAMWAFFVALGALDPGDAVGITVVVGLLLVLALVRSWAGTRDGDDRDPRLVRNRERRGF
jgi:hypothetical protein